MALTFFDKGQPSQMDFWFWVSYSEEKPMGDSELKHVEFLKGRTENIEEKYIAASPMVLEWIKGLFGLGAFPTLSFIVKK